MVIRVNKIVYNGRTINIDAKITIANQKHIFFNNIKGKHQYWKNAKKSTTKGKKVYDRMWAKTKKYFHPGIEIIISPIAFVTGTVVYVANIAVSPVLAIFSVLAFAVFGLKPINGAAAEGANSEFACTLSG